MLCGAYRRPLHVVKEAWITAQRGPGDFARNTVHLLTAQIGGIVVPLQEILYPEVRPVAGRDFREQHLDFETGAVQGLGQLLRRVLANMRDLGIGELAFGVGYFEYNCGFPLDSSARATAV